MPTDEPAARSACAGYIGFDQGGQLTEAVRRRPYAVILFDEVCRDVPSTITTGYDIYDIRSMILMS